MARTPEAKVKHKVADILKASGVYYFFPATYGYGRSGVADIICCVGGRFLAIECKAGKNTPTLLQERELIKVLAAGGVALVINEKNVDEIAEVIEELKVMTVPLPSKSKTAQFERVNLSSSLSGGLPLK